MAWASVVKGYRRPIGWWYHKILAEIGWVWNLKMYHTHLDAMTRNYGYNLYGQPFKDHRPRVSRSFLK